MDLLNNPAPDNPMSDKPGQSGKRGGAPRENRNHLRHGLCSGKLPSGMSYVTKVASQFRKALENATLAAHDQIDVAKAATIAAAMIWFIHGAKARRWAEKHDDDFTHDQRLAFSREEAKAADMIAKHIRDLNLDTAPGANPFGTLIVPPGHVWPAEHDDAPQAASALPEIQQATDEPASPLPEASPPDGLASEKDSRNSTQSTNGVT